jgi:hypothetical protein
MEKPVKKVMIFGKAVTADGLVAAVFILSLFMTALMLNLLTDSEGLVNQLMK